MNNEITEEVVVEAMPSFIESLDGKSLLIGTAAGVVITKAASWVNSKIHLTEKVAGLVSRKKTDVVDVSVQEVESEEE